MQISEYTHSIDLNYRNHKLYICTKECDCQLRAIHVTVEGVKGIDWCIEFNVGNHIIAGALLTGETRTISEVIDQWIINFPTDIKFDNILFYRGNESREAVKECYIRCILMFQGCEICAKDQDPIIAAIL